MPKLLKGKGLPLEQSPIPVLSEGGSWFLPGHLVVSRESYGTLLVVWRIVVKMKFTVAWHQGGVLVLRQSLFQLLPIFHLVWMGKNLLFHCLGDAGEWTSYLRAVLVHLFVTWILWSDIVKCISSVVSSMWGWGAHYFPLAGCQKLVPRSVIDHSSMETNSCCVFVSGNLGEPVLLPFWLPVPGVYNSGGILLPDQHCHGVFPALCWGEISMFVVWVAQGTCSWESTGHVIAAAQQRLVWPSFMGVIVPNVSLL